MSLINTLLTGVSIVGKVCQGLSGAFGKNSTIKSSDGKSEVLDSDLTVGGANFYSSDTENPDGKRHFYIFNPTSLPISLCLPNINDAGGIEYLVSAKKSRDISLVINESVTPNTELLIGPVSDANENAIGATAKDTAVKICVNRLPLDNTPVMIGGVTVKADAQKGVVTVQATDSAIGSLTYFSAVAESGVSAEIQDVIYPSPQDGPLKIGVTRTYDINLKGMGFGTTDRVGCRLYFSLAAGAETRLAGHDEKCITPPECYVRHLMRNGRLN